jgi:hypothetical protein
MEHDNSTRNQHYVSQAEQRLNAIDPQLPARKQRIYRFEVGNRDAIILRPESARPVPISKNLSVDDLFSFDIDGDVRKNLEAQFRSYEDQITEHSRALVRKLAARQHDDLKEDLLSLFVCKFLAFLRNPNCIRKVLNSLGALPDHHLTAAKHGAAQAALVRGNRPHQASLCRRLGISEEMYDRWLRALFLLVTRSQPDQPNFLELMVKELFESQFVMVLVYNYVGQYASEPCLLSDRGHTISVETSSTLGFDFNICRSAFARFGFSDIDAHVPLGFPAKYVEAFKRRREVTLHYAENDIAAHAKYNANTACQCTRYVYSSSRNVRC